ncbi:MAG: protein kinase [Planctomycetota bacterium]
MKLKPGTSFVPGYRLKRYIGRGQFGQVWEASAPGGISHAVKFIDLSDGHGQKEYAAIRRVKRITHANLMPLTAIWQLDADGELLDEPPDSLAETAELFGDDPSELSGYAEADAPTPETLAVGMLLGKMSLEELLPKRGQTSSGRQIAPRDLLRYMEGVARGLDFLNSPQHDFGKGPVALQHCDIKPANIVVVGDSAVICDFGLARILSSSQVTATQTAGTPAYMSPEAIDGKPSCNSDQYSLAITYFHLRTGNLPMDDRSLYTVLEAHRSGLLKFDAISREERVILKRATHLDWKQRFDSNTHLIDALRQTLSKQGLLEGPSLASMPRVTSSDQAELPPMPPGAGDFETMASDELTDAVLSPSKVHTDDTLDVDLAKQALSEEAASQPAEQVELNRAASQQHAAKTQLGQSRSWMAAGRSGFAVAGTAAALMLLGVIWFRLSRDANTPIPTDPSGSDVQAFDSTGPSTSQSGVLPGLAKDKPADSGPADLAEVVALLDSDPELAGKAFAELISMDASVGRLEQSIHQTHSGPVERLIGFSAKDQALGVLTSGYDRFARVSLLSRFQSERLLGWESRLQVAVPFKSFTRPITNRDCVAVSADSRWAAIAVDEELWVWNLQTAFHDRQEELVPTVRHSLPGPALCIAFCPDEEQGMVIGLETQLIALREFEEQSEAYSWGTQIAQFPSTVRFSESGTVLYVKDDLGGVVAFEWSQVLTGKMEQSALEPSDTGIDDCEVFSVSGENVFVGHTSGTISVQKFESDASVFKQTSVDEVFADSAVTTLALSGEHEMVLAGSLAGSISLKVGEAVSSIPEVGNGPIRTLAIAPEGDWCLAGDNRSVGVFQSKNPTRHHAWIDTGGRKVESLLLSPEFNRLVVGCGDGVLLEFPWDICRLRALSRPHLDEPAPEQKPTLDGGIAGMAMPPT